MPRYLRTIRRQDSEKTSFHQNIKDKNIFSKRDSDCADIFPLVPYSLLRSSVTTKEDDIERFLSGGQKMIQRKKKPYGF